MKSICLPQFHSNGERITVSVPASKSLLNRALVLAAFCNSTVTLECGTFAEDTRALIGCLNALGICVEHNAECLTVHGCNGNIPNKNAEINVMSAGTAARFLTVALAFCGGDYTVTASEQMQQRPMEVLSLLENAGVSVEYLRECGHLPIRLHSTGIAVDELTVDTDTSTQYASAILLAAPICKRPFTLKLTGSRTNGSYIGLTLQSLEKFGISWTRTGDEIVVSPTNATPNYLQIEPDISGACYFYALALLCSAKVLVRRVRENSKQGDMKFLHLLADRGVQFTQLDEGLLADGSSVKEFNGFIEGVKDFSDQALTICALAPFAASPTHITGVAHIRKQECDRVCAIQANLARLGIKTEVTEDSVTVFPASIQRGTIDSFGDHRVVMSFALAALKTGIVTINDPDCCKKTFDDFFEIVARL
ncbi:MAG: 3-phosphoshikimate 1-carboxyvinyltransferase [Clostridia bacterium]|nr:3-phosphoshikimate 1-carboxyvinyltransferase [Clostridia bacterium]